MPKVKHKEGSRKARTPAAGDVFVVANDINFVDQTDDGVADLVVEHIVTVNGELFHKTQMMWPCIDTEIQDGFERILEKNGLEDGSQTFSSFKDLVHYWKKLTKVLDDITAFGEQYASQI